MTQEQGNCVYQLPVMLSVCADTMLCEQGQHIYFVCIYSFILTNPNPGKFKDILHTKDMNHAKHVCYPGSINMSVSTY